MLINLNISFRRIGLFVSLFLTAILPILWVFNVSSYFMREMPGCTKDGEIWTPCENFQEYWKSILIDFHITSFISLFFFMLILYLLNKLKNNGK